MFSREYAEWVILGLLCIPQVIYCVDREYCLQCNQARRFDDCTRSIKCGEGEYCYTEEIVNQNGIFYNAGCRDSGVCKRNPGGKRDIEEKREVGEKRGVDDLVACTRCCQGLDRNATVHNCNAKLCGLLSTQTAGTETLAKCYHCDHVHDVNECNEFVTCDPHQICGSEAHPVSTGGSGGDVQFSFGCFRKDMCLYTTKFVLDHHSKPSTSVGRRESNIDRLAARLITNCNACCGGSYCNTGECVPLLEKLLKLRESGHLNMTSLTYQP